MESNFKKFRVMVKETAVYRSLNRVNKDIITNSKNLNSIFKSLKDLKEEGIIKWETSHFNSKKNAEIIRELYINSLEVTF